ncbi:hypothetical protein QBC45DRAFT_178807 [Copromyces sp. CBS 386.78]|nr:hypothetical protein QBC45DRAFT_178807 [Copromyces sp. CBS 386.78]
MDIDSSFSLAVASPVAQTAGKSFEPFSQSSASKRYRSGAERSCRTGRELWPCNPLASKIMTNYLNGELPLLPKLDFCWPKKYAREQTTNESDKFERPKGANNCRETASVDNQQKGCRCSEARPQESSAWAGGSRREGNGWGIDENGRQSPSSVLSRMSPNFPVAHAWFPYSAPYLTGCPVSAEQVLVSWIQALLLMLLSMLILVMMVLTVSLGRWTAEDGMQRDA